MATKGRPTKYSKKLAEALCARLAEGISLRTVCKAEEMPGASTVFEWLRKYKDFAEQYARAKEESSDALIEDLQEIGDKAIGHAEAADPKASNAVVSAYKLKADNIKWAASKLKPKKYGDKVDLTSDGKAIEGNTIVFKNFSGTPANSKRRI